MSDIDSLIADLCPNGVEFKSLGELGEFIRGSGLQKKDLTDEGVGAIHYGEIHTHYGTSAVETKSFVVEALAAKLRKARSGDLIIATTSEDDAAVAKAVAWVGGGDVAVSSDAYIYRHTLDPKYVAYFFQSNQFQEQKKRFVTGTKVRRVSGESLSRIRIPVPPLEVQAEVVAILDKFDALVNDLSIDLPAELRARRQQYEHYREIILRSGSEEDRYVRLNEVADIKVGFPFKSAQFSDDPKAVALVRGDNVGQGTLKNRSFKRWTRTPNDGLLAYELIPGDVVLAMDRPWIPAGLKWARIGEDVIPALLVQRVARLRAHAGILDQRFLGSLISSPAFTEHVLAVQTGNTVPHISGDQIGAFRFALPSVDEQADIAAMLEKFGALVNDLSIGLPAELNARRKQYEYYRDRLLTFPEAA